MCSPQHTGSRAGACERAPERYESAAVKYHEALRDVFAAAFAPDEPDVKDRSMKTHQERGAPAKRDFPAALALVQRAGQAVRDAEERSDLIARRANEELAAAEARLRSAEARARAAEARAKEAETRAKEAEEWLVRVHDTIAQRFPSEQERLDRTGRRFG